MIAILISNKVSIQNSACNALELKYRNRVDAFDMVYENDDEWVNQNRIGAYFDGTKRNVIEKVYRQTNGQWRSGNVSIDKAKDLITDQMDEDTHDALSTALKHSFVSLNDIEYFHQGTYEEENNPYNNLSSAKATLTVQKYNQTNVQC